MTITSECILLVEDDPSIAEILIYSLTDAGYLVTVAENSAQAESMLEREKPNLILLDWMLPDKDGIRFFRNIRNIRRFRDIAVIVLSARNTSEDQAFALDQGIDDFISKPFSLVTLLARIRSVLRRNQLSNELVVGNIKLNSSLNTVIIDNKVIKLYPVEVVYMTEFLQKPDHVFSRRELMMATNKNNQIIEQRTIDVHVSRLRQKLKKNGANIIQTVRGTGYTLNANIR